MARSDAHAVRNRTDLERFQHVIEGWRKSLIDLSGRNRLLNFKHAKSSTLELDGEPRQELLAGRLSGGWRFHLPDDEPDPSADSQHDSTGPLEDGRAEGSTQGNRAHRSPNGSGTRRVLRNLRTRSQRVFNDYGLWTLYLGVGILGWCDDRSQERSAAPLVLVPARLVPSKEGDVLLLVSDEEEPRHNPALPLKLDQLGLDWTDVVAVDPTDIPAVLAAARKASAARSSWEVEERVVLAMFASHKEAMYQDLLDHEGQILTSDLVRAIALGPSAGLAPDRFDFHEPDLQRIDETCPPETTPLVLDADASQRQAIAAAIEGKSFALDGPPGTGKSQTITNMIAGLMQAGRSVLFVSEKAAALDVVHSRLKHVGLDSYALALHSHNTTRKAVAQALGRALTEEPRAPQLSTRELAKAQQARKSLSGYAAAMNEVRLPLQRTLHDVIGRISQLSEAPVAYLSAAHESSDNAMDRGRAFRPELLSDIDLEQILSTAQEISAVWSAAADEDFPWRGLRTGTPHPRPALEQASAALDALTEAVARYQPLSSDGAPITALAMTERLTELLATLPSRPAVPEHWLTAPEMADAIEAQVDDFRPRLRTAKKAVAAAERLAGRLWQELSPRLKAAPGPDELALTTLHPSGFDLSDWSEDTLRARAEKFEEISRLLTGADQLARAVTAALGLPAVKGVEDALRACDVAALGEKEHRPLETWFDPEHWDDLHHQAAEAATSAVARFFEMLHDTTAARARAAVLAGSAWDRLAPSVVPDVPRAERDLARLEPAGLDLTSLTRRQVEQLRARCSEVSARLASAQEAAERVSRRIGLDVPESVSASLALSGVIAQGETAHRPLAAWLEPDAFPAVSAAAAEVEEAFVELVAARAATQNRFRQAVLDVEDLPELVERLKARNRLGGLFSRQQRTDRKRALALTESGQWSAELIEGFDRALAWWHSHRRLVALLEHHRPLLGHYADDAQQGLDALSAAVAIAAGLHHTAPDALADPGRRSLLTAHAAHGTRPAPDVLELGRALSHDLDSWSAPLDVGFVTVDGAALAEMSCRTVADWFRAHLLPLDEAAHLIDSVERLKAAGGHASTGVLTLGQAREVTAAVRKARAATAAFNDQAPAHERLLGPHYRGLETTLPELREALDDASPLDRLIAEAIQQCDTRSSETAARRRLPLLGHYGEAESGLDLVALAAALDTMATVRRLVPEALADQERRAKLAAQLTHGRRIAPELIRNAAQLRHRCADWRSAAARPYLSAVGTTLLAQPLGQAATWFEAHVAPMEDAALLIRSVRRVQADSGLSDSNPTVAESRDVTGAVVAARAADATLLISRETDEALLEGLYRGVNTDPAELSVALDWAHKVRRIASGRDSAPLRPEAARMMCSIGPDPAIARRLKEWTELSEQLFGHFKKSRRRELRLSADESFLAARELLDAMVKDTDGPEHWWSYAAARTRLKSFGLDTLVDQGVERGTSGLVFPELVERAVLQSWTEHQLATDSRLRPVSGTARDALVTRFQEHDRQLVESAPATVIAACNARRPRRLHSGQAGILLRQSQLKRRHMPVRELLSETRDVVRLIKPCFMMSPLTVSQFLPPDFRFDVVIFDEASQVLPQDAVNCVYRGDALIVAGDQKQLPPTSFFNTAGDDDDDEDAWAEDDGSFESVLDACKASGVLRSLPLRWHYRSRHEELITFSNRSFYENAMVTFPGALEHGDDIGVAFFQADGVYDRGRRRDNRIEAELVAERVIHHFTTRPGLSLGVVALSQAQAQAIDEAVQKALSQQPELRQYVNEDRLDGFFIKNLESVQGDERDVMIMSIGYGPDAQGTLRSNFGPINKEGGWRRLNVAATRARRRMEVVASFDPSRIADQANPSVQHLKRFLEYARSGPGVLEPAGENCAVETRTPFEKEVQRVLTGWGYDVQAQIGVAGYRIGLGIRHPDMPGTYALGIECDGAMYHSAFVARDRDRLRESVLRGLGWRLYRVWSTDWYRNRPDAEARLRAAIQSAVASRPHLPEPPTPLPHSEFPEAETEGTSDGAQARTASPLDTREIAFVPTDEDRPSAWSTEYNRLSEAELVELHRRIAKSHRTTSYDLTDAQAAGTLVKVVHEILKVEAPMHMEVLFTRVRDAWQKGRSGKVIQESIRDAVHTLARRKHVTHDKDVVDLAPPRTLLARFPGSSRPRKAEHVPPSERQVALIGLVTESPGISREELLRETARFFGWGRLGADIRTTLEADVDELLDSARLAPTVNGLTVVGDSASRPASAEPTEAAEPLTVPAESQEAVDARCLRLLAKDGYEILQSLQTEDGLTMHMALHPNLQLPDRGPNVMSFACLDNDEVPPDDQATLTHRLLQALALVETMKSEVSLSMLWVLVTSVTLPEPLDGFVEGQGLILISPEALAAWETSRLVPYFDEDAVPDVGSLSGVSLMLEPTS
ncbi:DUF3320 domain-containing protein [Streptomyces sp. NPDC054834]